jgi:acetoacetate decarboxylase
MKRARQPKYGTMSNNIPLHNPLFPPSLEYGSNDAEAVSVLLQVDEGAVRNILAYTPFKFVSAHTWIEVIALRNAWGVQPFCGGGIIIPARYRNTIGGYYAYCYIDTDDALALGREPFGYPKKYAQSFIQRTGSAAVAAMRRTDAAVELSVIINSRHRLGQRSRDILTFCFRRSRARSLTNRFLRVLSLGTPVKLRKWSCGAVRLLFIFPSFQFQMNSVG